MRVRAGFVRCAAGRGVGARGESKVERVGSGGGRKLMSRFLAVPAVTSGRSTPIDQILRACGNGRRSTGRDTFDVAEWKFLSVIDNVRPML